MVVFSCGECGEAMKKAQVENHYQRKCRNCNVLSCLDCGKDFWGKDYEQHTKCISEEEKYSGKNYVARPGANKGEVKQQQWLQEVQNAIDKVKTNPKLKDILERMKPYENIPRKKAKFENFLKNSLRVNDKRLAQQAWDLVMANTDKPTSKPAGSVSSQNGSNTLSDTSNQQQNGKSDRLESQTGPADTEESAKKLSKRERKEERRKKSNKMEKKDKQVNGGDICGAGVVVTKNGETKLKKRKRKYSEEEDEQTVEQEEEQMEEQGKKRKFEEAEDDEEDDEEESSEPQKKVFKTKFKWNDIIVELLRSKGEMKLKKLRRKVLAEYQAQGCTAKSEEKLWAKFDRKLQRNPVVKVLHDRAKLVA